MFVEVKKSQDQKENYTLLLQHLPYYINKQDPMVSTLANAAAVLRYFIDDINWVGFYLYDQKKLYLGPFQGLAACSQIKLNHGVCGQAAAKGETVIVQDVDRFPGHITCDSNSKSEIVIPLMKDNKLIGVLDIDAPRKNRFSESDQIYLEKAARLIVDNL